MRFFFKPTYCVRSILEELVIRHLGIEFYSQIFYFSILLLLFFNVAVNSTGNSTIDMDEWKPRMREVSLP